MLRVRNSKRQKQSPLVNGITLHGAVFRGPTTGLFVLLEAENSFSANLGHKDTCGAGGHEEGLTLARAVPAALHAVDDFLLQLLALLLLGRAVAPLSPPLGRPRVQHPAALRVPHLVVEAAGAGQEI